MERKPVLSVNRSGCHLIPNNKLKEPEAWEKDRAMADMNVPHWRNFLECIRTRQKPISEIETCVRSSTVCLLANLSMRFRSRIDWDQEKWTCAQSEMQPHLNATYPRTMEAGSLIAVMGRAGNSARRRLAIYSGAGSQPARGSQPRFREQGSRAPPKRRLRPRLAALHLSLPWLSVLAPSRSSTFAGMH
jgi:hypothetical protein